MNEVIDTQLVPAGFTHDKIVSILGYELPIGITFRKAVKDFFKTQYPKESGKLITARYDNFVKDNQKTVDVFEGEAQRTGWVKEMYRVDKKGCVFTKYTPPSDADSLQLQVDVAVAKKLAAEPNIAGKDLYVWAQGVRNDISASLKRNRLN